MDVVDEVEPGSLEEARRVVRELRERHRSQAHQLLTWRRRAKSQEELLARLAREHAEQLRGLSSQLLLFEAGLCRKQKDIRMLLSSRESAISRQQRIIRAFQRRLADCGLDASLPDVSEETDVMTPLGGGDNDSDSAVILEDGSAMDLQLVLPLSSVLRYNSANAAVQRSISDATKFSSSGAGSKRTNGLLRRPEVLETVYSVEEDQDADGATPAASDNTANTDSTTVKQPSSDSDDGAAAVDSAADSETDEETSPSLSQNTSTEDSSSRRAMYGSFERLTRPLRRHPPLRSRRAVDEDEPPPWSSSSSNVSVGVVTPGTPQQVTYNRVMSNNHRSVTKPKDVKYKRINKAKSKSLEELRGRLRTWVDNKNPAPAGVGTNQRQLSVAVDPS